MKKTLAILSFAAVGFVTPALTPPASAQSPAAAAPASTVKKLTRAELDALLAQPERVLILDVRRPDELQSIGSFPAFLSIQAADLEKNLKFVPTDRQIVTISNHASRATRAADLLAKHGFTVVGAVGVEDYEAEGGTVAKITAPAPKPADAAAANGRRSQDQQGK